MGADATCHAWCRRYYQLYRLDPRLLPAVVCGCVVPWVLHKWPLKDWPVAPAPCNNTRVTITNKHNASRPHPPPPPLSSGCAILNPRRDAFLFPTMQVILTKFLFPSPSPSLRHRVLPCPPRVPSHASHHHGDRRSSTLNGIRPDAVGWSPNRYWLDMDGLVFFPFGAWLALSNADVDWCVTNVTNVACPRRMLPQLFRQPLHRERVTAPHCARCRGAGC